MGKQRYWKKLVNKDGNSFIAEVEPIGHVVIPDWDLGKQRAASVRVISIVTYPRGKKVTQVTHCRWGGGKAPRKIVYRVGRIVKADKLDRKSQKACGHGIHFFVSRTRAESF